MKPTPKVTQISLSITVEKLKEIDSFAEAYGIKRIEVFRRCLRDIGGHLMRDQARRNKEMLQFVSRKGKARSVMSKERRTNKAKLMVRRTKRWTKTTWPYDIRDA